MPTSWTPERIRTLRVRLGLTLEELAATLGYSGGRLSAWRLEQPVGSPHHVTARGPVVVILDLLEHQEGQKT